MGSKVYSGSWNTPKEERTGKPGTRHCRQWCVQLARGIALPHDWTRGVLSGVTYSRQALGVHSLLILTYRRRYVGIALLLPLQPRFVSRLSRAMALVSEYSSHSKCPRSEDTHLELHLQTGRCWKKSSVSWFIALDKFLPEIAFKY